MHRLLVNNINMENLMNTLKYQISVLSFTLHDLLKLLSLYLLSVIFRWIEILIFARVLYCISTIDRLVKLI